MKRIVSVRALIVKENKLLLVRGSSTPWHIPGGYLDEGESLVECAKREAYEETGYEVEVGDLVYCFEFFDKRWDIHKVELAFYTRVIKVPIQVQWTDLGHDQSIVEQKFFTLDEIQAHGAVKPECLKDGRWLEEKVHRDVYCGKE